ncbi:hypothetical protein M9978_21135 [Sphingomonas sp. MG17]|uniref:Uncharacterized protein n=1 Tax=Sphingomonas tagetis TaxID=2949092 RepID=A0A9X2KNJ4_9SPHN|nr:hypothetical protein [Sphingomonas tagetis]MCP3732925.1 hypothetical protein [Sphingomonas tagetis]
MHRVESRSHWTDSTIQDEAYARTDSANAEESRRQLTEQAGVRAKIDADLAAARGRSTAMAQPSASGNRSSATATTARAGIIVKDDRADLAREAAEKRQREADYAAQARAQAALDVENARVKAESEAKARNFKPVDPCKVKGCAKPE